ncbi:MAG TPA: flagellar hook-length control protein FliK [Dyella sp.]|uniref:flagellar hook-length control protein FliK n=1 Tax=Dyella sp. TaxID=1869338 RepID=UPI002B9F0B45|nr:flagellar hook-length control protein FliK [Dyella sp.]HUB90912.1 flagellar hook-length control protein FliK [Dyella sp.]
MSATPLTALPINPAPSAQPASSHSQQSGPSFHSHLQSAQQSSQQQTSADSSQADSQNNDQAQGSNAQGSGAQAGNPAGNASKPGADANDNQQNDAASDNGPGIDLTGGVGTLVGSVLSLIDHATGDAHAGAASASGASKQGTANKQAPATPLPPVPVAGMVPVPLPAIAPVATPAAANTNTPPTGNALAGIGSGLSSKADLKADDGFSAGDASTAGAGTPADASAVTQAVGDGTQALAGSIAASSHAALPAATTFTDNSSPSTSGITALGNLTAAAPVVPSGTAGTHSLTTDAPVGSSGFAKELGQQITWLSGQDVKQAQIRLNPQDLGPLDVKVSVEHGRVDVSFVTQHPDTTAAVQQSLGQLHQMLGGQGLSLGHATVGQQSQQQFGGQQGQQGQASGSANEEMADTPIATAARVAIGLVDAFA